MQLSEVVKIGARTLGRTGLKTQKYSPEILVGVGIAGLALAGIVAARATRKLDEVNNKHIALLETSEFFLANDEDYTETTHRKESVKIYSDWAFALVKLYGPAVTLGVAGTVSILGGHRILKQRNIAIAAAYKMIEASYAEYRKRVGDTIGHDKEESLYRGEAKSAVIDSKGKKTGEVILQAYPHGSPYARCYDEVNSREFQKNRPDLNLTQILSVQRFSNIKLQVRGYIFLNEIYEALGMSATPAGQIVGWMYDNTRGDGFIDFGLDDPNNVSAKRFLAGEEASVWLDFNVDGQIYNLI